MDSEITAKQNQITTNVNNAITNGAYPPDRHEEITRKRDEAERLIKDYKTTFEDATNRLKTRLDEIIKSIDDTVDRILRG
jgi:F0F1-type ATP synthase membrane subunit b/b'